MRKHDLQLPNGKAVVILGPGPVLAADRGLDARHWVPIPAPSTFDTEQLCSL